MLPSFTQFPQNSASFVGIHDTRTHFVESRSFNLVLLSLSSHSFRFAPIPAVSVGYGRIVPPSPQLNHFHVTPLPCRFPGFAPIDSTLRFSGIQSDLPGIVLPQS